MMHYEMFGAAKWIAFPEGDPASILFRAPFTTEKPVAAELTVVGLSTFEAAINGRSVSEDLFLPLATDYCPRTFRLRGRDFGEETGHRLYCPVYDVTHLIAEGENVLAVSVGSGWFTESRPERHETLFPYGCKRLCFSLLLEYADGSVRRVVSDETVKVKEGFVTEGHFRTGETHDYRGYDDSWMLPGFDASAWQNGREIEPMDTRYMISDCPADRVIRTIKPVRCGETERGVMYDCGENITGWPVLICRAPAGEEIVVRVAEELSEDGTLHPKHCHGQEMHFISDGTPRLLHPHFTWLAFRYFELQGKADAPEVRVIHTDVAVTSSFDSDNETLNWLYDAYIRTQLDNMHTGIPSDCPHLERCGYTGDGQLTCDAVMTMLDARAFYEKWIGDISDCQDRLSGHVQYTAPYVRCGGGPGGWGCAIVEVPYTFYKHYGDTELLSQLYPQMLHYFRYLDDHSEGNLVVSDRPDEWCLGDWCTPEKIRIPEPYVNTYFYVKSLTRMLEIAPLVGREADIPAFEAKMELLKRTIMEKYYDDATGDFVGNDQGANAFALDIGLGDERTYRHMADHYRESGCYDTGIFGTDIVTRLLFEGGDGDVAAALLTGHTVNGSFGHMQDLGATTLLEYWGDYARSYNHPMFGAVVRYLFQYLLGIRQPEGGCAWDTVCVNPVLVPGISRMSGHVSVDAGEISVAYEKQFDAVYFRVSVPAGVNAVFTLGEVTKALGAGENLIVCPAK